MITYFEIYENGDKIFTCKDFGVVLHEYLMICREKCVILKKHNNDLREIADICNKMEINICFDYNNPNKRFPIVYKTFRLTHMLVLIDDEREQSINNMTDIICARKLLQIINR